MHTETLFLSYFYYQTPELILGQLLCELLCKCSRNPQTSECADSALFMQLFVNSKRLCMICCLCEMLYLLCNTVSEQCLNSCLTNTVYVCCSCWRSTGQWTVWSICWNYMKKKTMPMEVYWRPPLSCTSIFSSLLGT